MKNHAIEHGARVRIRVGGKMSFSTSVKNELCSIENVRSCCIASEICGMIKLIGQFNYVDNKLGEIFFSTESEEVAERFSKGIEKFYGINAVVREKSSRRSAFEVTIPATNISEDIINDLESVIPEYYKFSGRKSGKCCIKAFLRGAFLAAGYIGNPRKTYHLEFNTKDENTAGIICALLNDFNLNPKIILRKGGYVVYIKDAEFIFDFLALAGAHKSVLDYENVRVVKEMRNNINRAVNCETANLQKTLDASFKQIESIKLIRDVKGLGALPEHLKQLAILRLENPDLSMSELGALLDPPIGKSGVSHRMRRIINYAEELNNIESEVFGRK